MTDREKLAELIFKSLCRHIHKSCKLAENIADDLIANGVTVKEWVSVSESPKENGTYCVIVENHKNRKVKMRTYARYRNGRWLDLYDDWENRCWHITHWMPLPEPPEEEEMEAAKWE